jgi:hypothetical protein
MALFRRRSEATETIPIDPALGDTTGARLYAALLARDWPGARDAFDQAADAQHFAFLVNIASKVTGLEEWLPQVVGESLGETLPLLVYGARAIGWAWDARTGQLARYVSQDRFELFFERLRIAEDCLKDVVRREPDNAAAWHQLIITARGLELGQEESQRRFERVVALCPGHLPAHQAMLQNLCEKRSGSHQAMHTFAQQATATAAPLMVAPLPAACRCTPGSPLGHLIAQAHIEHWLREGSNSNSYLGRRKVKRDLHEAADSSVRHPDYRRQPGWPTVHNPFAMAFSLAHEKAAAAEQFQIIGDLYTEIPWGYLTAGASTGFRTWRRRAIGS